MKTEKMPCLVLLLASLFFSLPACANEAPAPSADKGAAAISQLADWLKKAPADRPALSDQPFARTPLTKSECQQALQMLWDAHVAKIQATRAKEWNDKEISAGGQVLKFKERTFGKKPKDGWSLYISLHGGGNAPAAVNDQQWNNQIQLYQPKEGLYVAPRAPTNNWDLWHEPNVDVLLNQFLDDAFALADVNPNRVYIMGYSAGGDGVYQLAPRMADRWAAASMMAGHPNDASPLGLRDLPFAIHVGALDSGYNRNKVAEEWKKKLDDLQAADPKGYVHVVQLHAGRAHWMNLEDKVAVDWMATFTRDPIPPKVVWMQSHVTHDRFYWLAVPPKEAKGGALVIASRKGQDFQIEKTQDVSNLILLLNDAMLDLDRPVKVMMNDKELFNGVVPRTIENLQATLSDRGDRFLTFSARIPLSLDQKPAK